MVVLPAWEVFLRFYERFMRFMGASREWAPQFLCILGFLISLTGRRPGVLII
jgi:hypothetical protein